MLLSCKGLSIVSNRLRKVCWELAFAGLQISQVCNGMPFFALDIRPVTGVYLTGMSDDAKLWFSMLLLFGRGAGAVEYEAS